MGINKIGVIMNSRTKRVKKQIAGATDIGLAVSWPPPGPSGQKRLGTWKSVVSEKVVGVDISVLFHGLFGKKTSVVRQMLTVNPEASVKYVVAETMNQWFIQHELFHAKVVVFVHDPKLVQQWHCSDCKKAFDKAIAVKYEVTGRSRRQDAAVERDKEWKKKVAAFAAECAGQPEAVREATGKWTPPWDEGKYKSTWSTILQTMSGTSPRIPSLSWVESPKVWGVMDDLKHLSEALMRCSFKASIGKSTKELTKARIMNTDGQVYWDNFEVKAGATIVKGETVETILFRLQCVPSMKTNIYSVDMVFHERKGDSKLHLSPELSYCDCQRGAIASDMCGHRNATFFWLHTVRREWGQRKGTDGWQSPPNFYKLAAAIGLPRKILLMARIPIQSSELQTLLFQSSSASKKRKWGDATEEKVGKHNKEYLKHATDGDGKAIVQLVCQNLLQQHRRGEVDLREYEQAEFFTYLITQYTKRAQS